MWLLLVEGISELYLQQILKQLPESAHEDLLDQYQNMIVTKPIEMYEAFSTLAKDYDLELESLSDLLVLEIHARIHAYYPYSQILYYRESACRKQLLMTYNYLKTLFEIDDIEEEQDLYDALSANVELEVLFINNTEKHILLQYIANFYLQLLYNSYYDVNISKILSHKALFSQSTLLYAFFSQLLSKAAVENDDVLSLYESIDVYNLLTPEQINTRLPYLITSYENELMLIPFYDADEEREQCIQRHLTKIRSMETDVAYIHCSRYLLQPEMTVLTTDYAN